MRVSVLVFGRLRPSEGAGVHHAHHDNVSNGGNDGDPEPDGIAGHGLRLILLPVHRRGRGRGVDAGRRVEERVFAAVVVIGRGVHEGPRHDWDLWEMFKTHVNIIRAYLLTDTRTLRVAVQYGGFYTCALEYFTRGKWKWFITRDNRAIRAEGSERSRVCVLSQSITGCVKEECMRDT